MKVVAERDGAILFGLRFPELAANRFAPDADGLGVEIQIVLGEPYEFFAPKAAIDRRGDDGEEERVLFFDDSEYLIDFGKLQVLDVVLSDLGTLDGLRRVSGCVVGEVDRPAKESGDGLDDLPKRGGRGLVPLVFARKEVTDALGGDLVEPLEVSLHEEFLEVALVGRDGHPFFDHLGVLDVLVQRLEGTDGRRLRRDRRRGAGVGKGGWDENDPSAGARFDARQKKFFFFRLVDLLGELHVSGSRGFADAPAVE